jgi:hypothetical protein
VVALFVLSPVLLKDFLLDYQLEPIRTADYPLRYNQEPLQALALFLLLLLQQLPTGFTAWYCNAG